ncbi:MAG: pentapeptide repeat-containing protein [Elainellaceae cyanobacterium]
MINRLRQLFQSILPIQMQAVSILKAVGCFILSIAILSPGLLHPPVALADNYDKDYLVEEDFSGRDLTDSSFTLANMRKANLSHADLRGVSLFSAHLEEANLEGANLSGATLDKAHLVKANLKNAILENAFAFNARFNGATIDGADFTGVLLRQDMQDLLCDVADGVNPVTGRATRDTLDCFY